MAHRLQAVPFGRFRQRSLSITGTAVRLKREKRLMNAEMGQNRPHHLRKNTSSMTSMAGTNRSDQFKSPAPNRLTSKATAAKVRPTGHTRQNTGNPEHSRRQQRTAEHRMARVERRVALGVASPAGGAVVSRRRLFQRCDLLGGEGLVRLRGPPPSARASSWAEELLHPAPQGHGQIQPQNRRPKKQHEGDGHHDAQHRTRDKRLGRHHG